MSRRRIAQLARCGIVSPAEAADRIISAAQQWAATQDDDLTVLMCDYSGNGASVELPQRLA